MSEVSTIEAREIVVRGERNTHVIHNFDLDVLLKRGGEACAGSDPVPAGFNEAGTVALSLGIDGRDEVHVCPGSGRDVEEVLNLALDAIQTALAGVQRVKVA